MDTPYTEYVATRLTDAGTPSVNATMWGTLPTSGVYDLEVGEVGYDAGALMLSPEGVYSLAFGGTAMRVTITGPAAGACGTPQQPLADNVKCSLYSFSANKGGLVTPNGVFWLTLTSPSAATSVQTFKFSTSLGSVNSTVEDAHSALWIGATTGLWMCPKSEGCVQVLTVDIWAVAYGAMDDIVVAGNFNKLYYFHAAAAVSSAPLVADPAARAAMAVDPAAALQPYRWQWVTDVATGSGGAIDDHITGMAFDSNGLLYIANPTCLNVRARNGSISRVAGLQGLPYNQLRAVAIGSGSPEQDAEVWLASDMGVSLWNRAPGAMDEWRYFFGTRYHPGTKVVDIASGNGFTVFATDGGVAYIEDQAWTLAKKAAHMETILDRHNRLVGPQDVQGGVVSDCSLATFGNALSCHNHQSDNNGLWTSLVVVAEAMRYNVTSEADALTKASHFFYGMRFLNLVTGIKGLMARSAIPEGVPTGSGAWHNSTAYPGWTWKGDTSSDEVTGHMFAYPLIAQQLMAADSTAANLAIGLIDDIATYIVNNGFKLIDVTGKATTWGHWEPAFLNGVRSWSDERGVNSNQILAFLASAYKWTGNSKFIDAFNQLTNSTNQYEQNLLNLKIEAPCDDNYSDDELTFLPYYTRSHSLTPPFNDLTAIYASMNRTFNFVRPWRSDLWNAITVAITGNADDDVMESIMWNLRTWPLSLVDWPVTNSHRQDLFFRSGPNRFAQSHTDSVRVLPANERNQYRWNGNPHALDGGGGETECDPGAWLLPYWMARFHGLIKDA